MHAKDAQRWASKPTSKISDSLRSTVPASHCKSCRNGRKTSLISICILLQLLHLHNVICNIKAKSLILSSSLHCMGIFACLKQALKLLCSGFLRARKHANSTFGPNWKGKHELMRMCRWNLGGSSRMAGKAELVAVFELQFAACRKQPGTLELNAKGKSTQ